MNPTIVLMRSGSSKMQNSKIKILLSVSILTLAMMIGGCGRTQQQETAADLSEEQEMMRKRPRRMTIRFSGMEKNIPIMIT